MQSFTARQAILNRKNKLVGYELLYRESEDNSFPDSADPHQATSRLINNTHLNGGLGLITQGRVAFINFTEKCLLSDFPDMLPKNEVVIELLETVTPSDEVYEKCRALFKAGYKIALDDFIHKPEWNRFIKIARVIKIDIEKTPLREVAPFVAKLREQQRKGNLKNNIALLAERVETQEDFLLAKEMGFDLFQGYYFCKPELHKSRDVDLSKTTLIRIYQELCKKELDINVITECFESDEGLTYKLLNFMNSGLFKVVSPISSIRQALVYLGEFEMRKFLTLLTNTELAKGRPIELVRMGTVRAKTCENTALKIAPGLKSEAFLVGLLSMLPAVLERDMADILAMLPVADGVRDALLPKKNTRKSVVAMILEATLCVEKGEWHNTSKMCLMLNLSYSDFCELHKNAILWSERYEQKFGQAA
jgi:EAL and modified HD-GYP domain-containing signal transduction protein